MIKITIITQDDPFYLPKNIKYLVHSLPSYATIVSVVILDASPFGKRDTFYQKVKRTWTTFGFLFFLHYGFKYTISRFTPQNNLKNILKKCNIPTIQLKKRINHPDSLKLISSYHTNLLISIAGNQIFKKELINLASKGCLNVHSALLPKYRGLMPSFWVLKNNEQETGVSVFFVDEGIDSGPILVQKKIKITPTMTQSELIKITKRTGMDAIIESIELIYHGNYNLIPNDNDEMTYFSFPTKTDVKQFKKTGNRFY